MLILELESFPIEQARNLDALEERLGQWVLAHPFPMRLLAYSHPFDMAAPLQRVRRLIQDLAPLRRAARELRPALRRLLEAPDSGRVAAAATLRRLDTGPMRAIESLCADGLEGLASDPAGASAEQWMLLGRRLEAALWRAPYLDELERFYEALAQRHVRAATYILITWEPPEVQAAELIAGLAYATGRGVRRLDRLPPAITAEVRVDEERARLLPTRPGDPYRTVLRSYEMPASFDAALLHPLMALPYDTAIAVDIRTLTMNEASRLAEGQINAARAALRGSSAVDPATAQRMADAERVLADLRTQALHQVQVAVLVTAPSAEALDMHRATARDRLGVQLRMEAVAGSQAELLRLFSTTPASQIDAAWRRSDMLSKGVGCLMGVLGYHRSSAVEGLFWGRDAFRLAPIYYDPFAGRRSPHAVVIGQSGGGKTFLLNAITIRAAALEGYRVIWIDAFENGPRLERAVGAGARRYQLGLGQTINILDLVYGPEDGPNWRLNQVQHVTTQLAMLMGNPAIAADSRRVLEPRAFTHRETGVIDRALMRLYTGLAPDAALEEMPVLGDMIGALEGLGESEAAELARDLRVMLYGSSTSTASHTARGASFDGHTTVDWCIADDVVCFDLTEIQRGAEELLALYYSQVIGAVYRFMRDPLRDRSRRTLLIIDEYGIAARVRTTEQLAVTLAKTARKFGLGLITVDQSPGTFYGSAAGREIVDNARLKIIFHLDDDPAHELAASLSALTPEHIQFIIDARQGHYVAVLDKNVVPVVAEPTRLELDALSGS